MKKSFLGGCLLLCSFIFCKISVGQNDIEKNEGVMMLTNFYSIYITQNDKMPHDLAKIEKIKQEYCSEKLLEHIEKQQYDYDPFLNSQDCDINWLKTLKVKEMGEGEGIFSVSYEANDNKDSVVINIKGIKKNGEFKIHKIFQKLE